MSKRTEEIAAAVARVGNNSRAAAQLGVTRQAVSQAMIRVARAGGHAGVRKTGRRPFLVLVGGVEGTVAQHAARLGVTVFCLYRLWNGRLKPGAVLEGPRGPSEGG